MHHPDCDVNDQNPDGIKKPCNCGGLLPCPFCNGSPRLCLRPDNGMFIECSECQASSKLIYPSGVNPRPILIEAWNTRAVALENRVLTTPTETPLTDQYTIQVRLGQTDVYEMLSAFDRLELKLNRALDAIAGLLPFAHAYSDHPKRNPDDKLNERTDKARAILREAGRIK